MTEQKKRPDERPGHEWKPGRSGDRLMLHLLSRFTHTEGRQRRGDLAQGAGANRDAESSSLSGVFMGSPVLCQPLMLIVENCL